MLIAGILQVRPNKKTPVFRVTLPYLNLLVIPRIFSGFLEKLEFYAFWKALLAATLSSTDNLWKQLMNGPDLDPNHSESVPERIFWRTLILKKKS